MSYCTVAEIGGAASIRHVEDAAIAIENEIGEHALYSPSATWEVLRGLVRSGGSDDYLTELGFRCISVSEIMIYDKYRLRETVSSVDVTGRYAKLDTANSYFEYQRLRLVITGVRGTATLTALSSGDDVQAGQSVVRAGAVVLYREDGTAMADDELIVPPAILRSAAISAGRRSMTLESDQLAMFDDSTYRKENHLTDGWARELQRFISR